MLRFGIVTEDTTGHNVTLLLLPTNMKIYKSLQTKTAAIAALLALAGLSPCQSFADTDLTISPGILYFKYIEFGKNGERLDKESGFLPGFSIDITGSNKSAFHVQAGLSYYTTTIDYDGMTQAGAPHTTRTNERLKHLHFAVGKTFEPDIQPFDVFLRFDLSIWDRDIKPMNGISGLYEKYQWNETGLVLQKSFLVKNNSHVSINLDIFRVTSPSVTVDLSSFGYGSPRLTLDPKTGFKTGLEWRAKIHDRSGYSVGFYFKQYGFGASDPVTLGGAGGTILEPRSETRQTGIEVHLYSPL